jgi:glycine cleavage system H lipoate-binding protein
MQAGVVRKKFCRIEYDCIACPFDRALRRAVRENKAARQTATQPKNKRRGLVAWQDKLNERPAGQRPCLHHMKGRIGFRLCTNEYSCGNCEFDQFFYDQYTVHAVVRPVAELEVGGVKVPQGFYLHRGHAWVKIEEGATVRIGLDDFAWRLLGPPDRIEAPLVGKTVGQNRPSFNLIRGSKSAQVLSPVSGVVTDVNPRLRERGGIAHESPYTDGWILREHSQNLRPELKNLTIAQETERFLVQEVDRLYALIEEVVPLAADGGQMGPDLYGNLPAIGWENLTHLFLHT